MKIVVRLPNWLGDMVMSTAFMRELTFRFPDAFIEVIVKQGIDGVADYLPGISKKWVFNKQEYPGLKGAWKFGKKFAANGKPDIFICLPESFSSATMARATGAKVSIGYAAELRSFLLTKTAQKDPQLHRVDQYLALLPLLNQSLPEKAAVYLENRSVKKPQTILVNVNSEAESRRLPVQKAISLITKLRMATDAEIILVGSPKEMAHVNAVYDTLPVKDKITNLAGKTGMDELIGVLGSAPVMLTTDSGPMHLANALGTHTVALEGASDERNTAPYNKDKSTLIRYGKLPCEPCVKNVCQFGVPACLMNMDEDRIVKAVLDAYGKHV